MSAEPQVWQWLVNQGVAVAAFVVLFWIYRKDQQVRDVQMRQHYEERIRQAREYADAVERLYREMRETAQQVTGVVQANTATIEAMLREFRDVAERGEASRHR